MYRLSAGISLILGNYVYKLLQDIPDYAKAAEISYYQAIAMLFIVWWPKIIGR